MYPVANGQQKTIFINCFPWTFYRSRCSSRTFQTWRSQRGLPRLSRQSEPEPTPPTAKVFQARSKRPGHYRRNMRTRASRSSCAFVDWRLPWFLSFVTPRTVHIAAILPETESSMFHRCLSPLVRDPQASGLFSYRLPPAPPKCKHVPLSMSDNLGPVSLPDPARPEPARWPPRRLR